MDRMPLLAHFDALFKAFRKSFLWLIVGCALGYASADFLFDGLKAPVLEFMGAGDHLVVTRFFERIGVLIRISMISGFLVASPFVGYEVFQFVGPALKEHERARVKTLISSLVLCFIAGCYCGYRWILPFIIKAVFNVGRSELVSMLTVSSYVNAAIGIILLSALFFEVPAIMFNLSLWGWVSSSKWKQNRRISIVVNAVVSAFLSPPDPMSMILMMLPLQLLFEVGIVMATLAEKYSNNKMRDSE